MKLKMVCIKGLLLKVVIILLVASNHVFAQEEVIQIQWGEKLLKQGDKEILVPEMKGQKIGGPRPSYYLRKPVNPNFNYQTTFEVLESTQASAADLNYLNSQYIEVGSIQAEFRVTRANTEKHAVLSFFPFFKENGQVKKVVSFKINIQKLGAEHVSTVKSFASNSVLRSGSGYWYKISITQDGFYKIDKSFLEECGIDVDNVDPRHINIYGNGDGRLPEHNALPRTDDLAKNAIQFFGEDDGVIDDDDFILFYGWGPHRWSDDVSLGFDQDRNPYSDISCYFINVNPSEPALRIQALASVTDPVTHNVNSYNFYDVHEYDAHSLVHGGQRWYGELFDTQLTRTFNFTVPNIDASTPAKFEISIASDATNSVGTSFTYSVNGSTMDSGMLPAAGGTDFGRRVREFSYPSPVSNLGVTISIVRNNPEVLTYLDRIVLNARRGLVMNGNQMNFRDLNSVGANNVSEFTMSVFPNGGAVWDVTDRHVPSLVQGNLVSSDFIFRLPTDNLREFAVTNHLEYFTPSRIGQVEHQDLHSLEQADYLIVTNKLFTGQANRLANLHRSNGLSVHVVNTEQVFNEFSSGMKDATAIRMFAKMFYDRGASDITTRPKNLLLFGDGTYDPKNRVPNNNNFILTYQVENSENHISSLVTDDYFGLLDDDDAIRPTDELDIGVGRLLISDNNIAKEQVDKIEHYMKNGSSLFSSTSANCGETGYSSTFGDWRLRYVQIADDEEYGYFIDHDVEPEYAYVKFNHPSMNCDKIYLDAYQQISTAGGQRYPDVNKAINDRIQRGALVMNYVGHGGEVGVAEERIIQVPQIQDWRNIDNLTLFVSATCEFTKYDDPDRVSAGEWASLNPYGAAIALMTTTRSVWFGVNTITGNAFFRNVFQREMNHEPRTFGEIIRRTKNEAGTSDNKRSFTLIGDPALKIALPRMNVVTDSINGLAPSIEMDTIRALSKVTIKGHIEDFDANILAGFNGTIYPTVYDKVKIQQTLGQDEKSPIRNFEIQTSAVYRGKASVVNGYFEFTFIVPKDINYSIDFGKISYYAENGVTDAIGEEQRFYIGGIDPDGLSDNVGPDLELFINDENFVNGGLTDENPILIARLFDENGINAVGNGIGHDLLAVLDGESGDPIVLNDYYTSDMDTYQSGEIRYNFSDLEPGMHTLTVKVWDVNNNSSEASVDFEVHEQSELVLNHVLNYPNPFTTSTEFFFEHNQVCDQLETQIQILTVSGKLVRTINQYVHTEGFRSEGIQWDGKDEFGDQLAKGVYVYRVSVKSPEGGSAEKLEKLVILK